MELSGFRAALVVVCSFLRQTFTLFAFVGWIGSFSGRLSPLWNVSRLVSRVSSGH